ncbi:putative RNA helicase [Dioscorea sansibarensis]
MAEPTTPTSNLNLSPTASPKVYQIGGVPVEFPYKPYGTQLAFMGRVIATLDRARRQGHCHALLESPTGTGKSLSLLCSTLAWQQHQLRRPIPGPSASIPLDPLVNGGGFIPEPEPSGNLEQNLPVLSSKAQKKKILPTIYYASRTHSQIAQVIRELRKTAYRVPMAVLASRKHYCTNKNVCTRDNVDEECKLLLKDSNAGCLQFKNAHRVKSHPSLQKGGCNEVHDIEDLVKVGRAVKGCSYFAAQTLAEEAQLVFCPYSYVMSPIVRRAMNIDIKGSILILDEAQYDMARDAGSVDVEEDVLHCSWTGDKAIAELQLAGITLQCFPVLRECATKAIKAASDVESDEIHLSGLSTITLEGLFSSLNYFFSGNGRHALDYQLALQRYVKRDSGNAASGWTCSVGLWCLNPAIVFKEIADFSLSVILTSG